jgi:uncharacterized protein YqjF (DUF2071 family)
VDFDFSILGETAHRLWPLPGRPWIMTQSWHDLLFAHWPVDADAVRKRVPDGMEVDLYDGQAWLAVVPFHMTNVAPRGVPPWPWLSAFAELNVRTYVRVAGRPGVCFFSLDAASLPAVLGARALFVLPYYWADMAVRAEHGRIHYRSRRRTSRVPARFVARYQPVAPPVEPRVGTLEHFLTERYCLFTADRRSQVWRVDIHHLPWPLQAAEAAIDVNSMASAAGVSVPATAPLLHFSKRQDVLAWSMERVTETRV